MSKKRSRTIPSTDAASKNAVLEEMLQRIGRTEEFPAISKYLIEINCKLSDNPETSNASELANIILNDYALTNKILKLVNSAFYGLAAGKVTTITRAVVVLGYENIRLATLSLALFEHFKDTLHIGALKEAVVASFWLGLMARDIAQQIDSADPEEAFICAMMSQLGKLLMIHYLPDDYQAIRDHVKRYHESEIRAARTVCGVTYEALGTAMAKQWNFPAQLLQGMQPIKKKDLRSKKSPISPLAALCGFVKELAAVVQDDSQTREPDRLEKVLHDYRKSIPISGEQLEILIQRSLKNIHQYIQALDYKIGKSLFIENLSTIRPVASQAQPHMVMDACCLNGSDDLRSEESQIHRLPKDIIIEGVQELSEALLADNDTDDVMVMSLEILYRSLGFQRALMFIHDRRRDRMEARFGYGPTCRRLMGAAHFSITKSQDLFNFSIQVGKDLVVADTADPKLSHLIPSWYRRLIDAPAFIFLPVMLQKVCMAAFYADRRQPGTPIDRTEHRHLAMLRNQLILAFKYRQHHR